MQDQGKRLLIAVALALGVMLVWNKMFPKDEPPPPAATGSQATGPKPATPQVGVASGSAAAQTQPAGLGSGTPAPGPAATAAKASEQLPRPPEEKLTLSFANVVATFSNYCGGLAAWQLTDKRYEHDATRGWLLPERSLMKMTDPNGKLVPVPSSQLVNLPDCGAFDVNFASSTFVVPRHAVWKGEKLGSAEVRYTYTSDQLEVVKTFTVMPERPPRVPITRPPAMRRAPMRLAVAALDALASPGLAPCRVLHRASCCW